MLTETLENLRRLLEILNLILQNVVFHCPVARTYSVR
jgi:hypothetical protein